MNATSNNISSCAQKIFSFTGKSFATTDERFNSTANIFLATEKLNDLPEKSSVSSTKPLPQPKRFSSTTRKSFSTPKRDLAFLGKVIHRAENLKVDREDLLFEQRRAIIHPVSVTHRYSVDRPRYGGLEGRQAKLYWHAPVGRILDTLPNIRPRGLPLQKRARAIPLI